MNRRQRLWVIFLNTYLSYFIILSFYYPYRAKTDESWMALAIQSILDSGSLSGAYNNGALFQIGSAIVLRISGLDYSVTQLLSPFVGGIALAAMVGLGFGIVRRVVSNRKWWEYALIGLSPLAFGGFLSRIRETSHKSYTYTLIFVLLFATIATVYSYRDQYKYYYIEIAAIIIIPFINFAWGIFHTLWIILSHRWRVGKEKISYYLALIPVVLSVSLAFLSSLVAFSPQFWIGHIVGIILTFTAGSSAADTSAIGKGTSNIASWGELTFASISFSVWYLYMASVAVVATASGVSLLFSLRSYIKRYPNQFEKTYIVGSLWYGFLIAGLIASGELPTIKRLIVLPGILGIIAFVITDWPSRKLRQYSIGIIIFLLLITAPLAAERTMLNGGSKPYDFYAASNEVTTVKWLINQNSECLVVSRSPNSKHLKTVIARKAGVISIPVRDRIPISTKKVYSSGFNGAIYCQ